MSDGNPLWEFSLEFYAQPGVASACLALQDRCGVDVNVLLLMCWCGLQGVCIDSASLARLLSEPQLVRWRRWVIEPLRRGRRGLSRRDMMLLRLLRRALAAVELAAERVEQAFLFAWWRRSCPHRGAGPVAPAALLANLASLWRVYGEPRGIAAHGLALLAAAFPAQSARELCPQCWARI